MSSSSSSAPETHEDGLPRRPSTRLPVWIPISAFLGTSLSLAIPLVILRIRQRAVMQLSLKENNTPPPRRVALAYPPSPRRHLPSFPSSSVVSRSPDKFFSSDSDRASVGDMMSAVSRVNMSTGMLAAKAFAIATGIVALGGAALVWSVKEALGVKDAYEFGTKMRTFLSKSVPSLSFAINRPLSLDEEGPESHHEVVTSALKENWKWENAEKRLKCAYEEGGVALWAQIALQELDAEVRLEREKRTLEVKLCDKDDQS